MRTSPASIGSLALVVGLALSACTAPAAPTTTAATSVAPATAAASPTGGATTQAGPAPATDVPTLAQAQEAMNQVVDGWTKANKRAWDPAVWDAVDAYPNRLTDTRPLSDAKRLKQQGRYKPSGASSPFTVKKVYAYSAANGT